VWHRTAEGDRVKELAGNATEQAPGLWQRSVAVESHLKEANSSRGII
jgi:hypothetical protein